MGKIHSQTTQDSQNCMISDRAIRNVLDCSSFARVREKRNI